MLQRQDKRDVEVNTEVSSRSSFPEFPLTGRVTRKLDGISWSRSLVFNLFLSLFFSKKSREKEHLQSPLFESEIK